MERQLPPWYNEIEKAIKEIGFFYCLNAKDLMPFLTNTWCGQMALCEYSEEFVKKTLDHMLKKY